MELQILISRLSFSVSLSNTPQAYMFWQVEQLKLINFLTETDSRYNKKNQLFRKYPSQCLVRQINKSDFSDRRFSRLDASGIKVAVLLG